MRPTIFVLAATFSLACSSPDDSESKEPKGPDTACEEFHARAQEVLTGEQAGQVFAGLEFAMSTPRCGTWHGAAGLVILKTSTAMDPERIGTISSVTKSFVATVAMQLVQEGVLALSDKVAKWQPTVPSATTMTIRDLLHMTSGLNDHWALGCTGAKYDEIVACVAASGLKFQPGTSFDYSNFNFLLLGLIVEQVTGHALHDEIRTRIIEPLSLTSTMFVGDTLPEDRVMHTYRGNNDVTGQEDPFMGFGSADMMASAGDLVVFFHALLKGELTTPDSLAEMKSFTPTNGAPPGSYGLGLIEQKVPDAKGQPLYTTWGHGGRGDVMTEAFYLPEIDTTASLLVNEGFTSYNSAVPQEMFGRILADLGPRIPPAK